MSLSTGVKSGDNFVPRGAEATAESAAWRSRSRMNPAAIAIAASVGKADGSRSIGDRRSRFWRRATNWSMCATLPGTAQIRNSNSYSIAAQVRRAGGRPRMLPVARDREESIRARVAASSENGGPAGAFGWRVDGQVRPGRTGAGCGGRAISHDGRTDSAG